MQQLLTTLIDCLFPPSKATGLIRQTDFNLLYKPGRFNEVVYLTNYRHPAVTAAITENKFNHCPYAAKVLGELLGNWTAENQQIIFVPIPLSSQRARERGYNQVVRILNHCPKTITSMPTVLRRSRHTQPQTTLSKEARLRNMTNAFEIQQLPDWSTISEVVLVDDVSTTGATLAAAKAALAPQLPPHIQLTCLAIAH